MSGRPLECRDRAIAEDRRGQSAEAELRSSGYPALHRVSCSISEGRVVLCGTVPSFYLKQVAQSLLLKRFGVEWQLENRLEVAPRSHDARS